MHDENPTKRYLVSGRVQGVGFRMFAAREAEKLGIAGYTRNLSDGRVEVVAHGTPDQLQQLRAALQRGPLFSSVSGVHEEEAQIEAFRGDGFVIEPRA